MFLKIDEVSSIFRNVYSLGTVFPKPLGSLRSENNDRLHHRLKKIAGRLQSVIMLSVATLGLGEIHFNDKLSRIFPDRNEVRRFFETER